MNIAGLTSRRPFSRATEHWDADRIGSQRNRVALITGANSGIGLETARELARAGARVVLVCRNEGRGQGAIDDIRRGIPDADLVLESADISDLGSVAALAGRLLANEERLDLLINNAGIMAVPRALSPDGVELQLATNHLGHFALTARLWPLLLLSAASAAPARVVNVASLAHRPGQFDFHDMALAARGAYTPMGAYRRSKLANLLFTHELARRSEAHGAGVCTTAAHPGLTQTRLFAGGDRPFYYALLRPLVGMVIQQAPMGALPTLRAAVDPDAAGGDYFGPEAWGETTGYPVRVPSSERSRDPELGCRLWEWSEATAGLTFLSNGTARDRT